MKASINKNIVTITGKLSEEGKITSIYLTMLSEFNSMCIIELLGSKGDHESVLVSISYDDSEATVATVKESYSEAKKSAR